MRQGSVEEQLRADPAVGSVEVQTFRAGGKGGQHQNTTDSGVRLRITITDGAVLTALREKFPSQVTDAGELLVEGREERSQHQNKARAVARAQELLRSARHKNKKRRARRQTLPPGVKRRRETDAAKRRRVKQRRRIPGPND